MMISVNKDYIVSERFIWDDLLARAEFTAKEVCKLWQKKRAIKTMAFAWPAEEIKDDRGRPINDLVSLEVQHKDKLQDALHKLTARTKAYAILVCDSTSEEVRVVLESHHGVRAWITPIERHGDVSVLGQTRVQEGQGGFGLLWRSRRASG